MDKLQIKIRKASKEDVPDIVRIISDNPIGALREDFQENIPNSYYVAFDRIDQDINQLLVVAEIKSNIVGTLQISFISNMSVKGAYRALIEGMHVDSKYRGEGVGTFMMEWAINKARQKGCNIAQLTSNKERIDAHRFYSRLGFVATHEGFKLALT
ncbi:MAG: GNAT family N-acetyltransferase [Rickettsiales bacterium]|jgi:GNAT superfamily N-acetyltransferase|nr:GNAT family N-acetyltransferase [Rickettsiales bacterium]